MEVKNTIVEYSDLDGNPAKYEIVMDFEAAGARYALLLPLDENDPNARLMRIEAGEQIMALLPIETEEENEAVMKAYAELMGDGEN